MKMGYFFSQQFYVGLCIHKLCIKAYAQLLYAIFYQTVYSLLIFIQDDVKIRIKRFLQMIFDIIKIEIIYI